MFGERLRQLRQKQNLSQEELAERVGVHNNSVSKWENGVIPNMKRIVALAKILGTTSAYLLGEDTSPEHEDIDLPATENSDAIASPLFIHEGDFIGSGRVLVYEDKGKRYVFPATKENQAWFRELVTAAIANNAVAQA